MKKISFITISAIVIGLGWFSVSCEQPTKSNHVDVHQHTHDEFGIQSHGFLRPTDGIYRMPYINGTEFFVMNDHHNHNPLNQYDILAGEDTPIVAAASGWIRGIVDHHGHRPNPGDGVNINGNPHDDEKEHSCMNLPPEERPEGNCANYNNYVWIEHPNGEWTKYVHLGTGTVQLPPPAGQGWSVGDWIESGQIIGLEGDIGFASLSDGSGPIPAFHLHFEAALPIPTQPLTWTQNGGFIQNGINLLPRICNVDNDTGNDENDLLLAGETYTALSCANQPPVANPGGPYEVNEGEYLQLDGTGSSDPEGYDLYYAWSPVDNIDDPSLSQPTFIAGKSMTVDLDLTVYDQVEFLRAISSTTIKVNNVAPTVAIDPAQVKVINEGEIISVKAEFSDPGWLDTHTASIDWGVPPGHEGEVISAPSVSIITNGGPGVPKVGVVNASYQYGDNDDGDGFTITVTVTDSDGGVGSDSFDLTVNNVDPKVSIDQSETVLLNGIPTIVASIGDDLTFNSNTTDPGSDDLTLTWDWNDGTSDSRISLVNAPNPDPLPSPTVQPRDVQDVLSHTFGDACLFEVSFEAEDDDGGKDGATLDVIITGLAHEVRSAGYWNTEYRMLRNSDFTTETLECYLAIANHISAVFSEHRNLDNFIDAVDVLWTRGNSNADALIDRELLTTWLNFANGAIGLYQFVDASGNGIADTPFLSLMESAEALRTDPGRTRSAVIAMKDILEKINNP